MCKFDVVVHENVLQLPHDKMLELLNLQGPCQKFNKSPMPGDEYKLVKVIRIDPTEAAFPVLRRRKYCIFIRQNAGLTPILPSKLSLPCIGVI